MCAGFGSGEDIGRDVGIFPGSGRGRQTKPREIDDSFLEFSRLGFCCKSESAALCAFSNPFSFSFLSGPGPNSPTGWLAWAHKLRYLFISRVCGSAVTVDRGIQS